MSRPAITAALALSLALAGCGGSGDDGGGKPSASRPATSSSASSSPSATTAAPALPEGYAWQTIDDASLKFAVPAEWTAINPKKLLEQGGDMSLLDDMAEKMGITPQQMKQAMGNADLMLLSPPEKGYADNVSGLIVPLEGLPTETQLKGQLNALSEIDVVVTPGTSPAGDMVAADYSLKVGENSVSGRTLFFTGEDAVLNLSVSALDPKTTAQVSEVIRTTIHKV